MADAARQQRALLMDIYWQRIHPTHPAHTRTFLFECVCPTNCWPVGGNRTVNWPLRASGNNNELANNFQECKWVQRGLSEKLSREREREGEGERGRKWKEEGGRGRGRAGTSVKLVSSCCSLDELTALGNNCEGCQNYKVKECGANIGYIRYNRSFSNIYVCKATLKAPAVRGLPQ